jgi:glutathione-independent formaldehyde dehydrogenase
MPCFSLFSAVRIEKLRCASARKHLSPARSHTTRTPLKLPFKMAMRITQKATQATKATPCFPCGGRGFASAAFSLDQSVRVSRPEKVAPPIAWVKTRLWLPRGRPTPARIAHRWLETKPCVALAQQLWKTHADGCGCGRCGGKPIAQRDLSSGKEGGNRGVIFMGPDHVEVQGIPYPKLELDSMSSPVESERQKRKCNHGAILKVVTTNICGSDQHMVRGRTSLPGGHMVLGHEITGEIVELGDDCEFLNVGDVCSVPFNIACGRCAACKRGDTGVCLNVNPARAGAAYGYVDMGGWIGGQSEYVMVPYADFNLLKFPDKDQAIEKIKDLTLLSDIFPTGFHGAIQAGVKPGSIVYVAGAGPVGLASAASCHLLGAACVIVGDMIPERLAQAKSFGCETIDLRTINGSLKDAIADMIPGSNGEVVSQASCCTQRTTHNAAQPPPPTCGCSNPY